MKKEPCLQGKAADISSLLIATLDMMMPSMLLVAFWSCYPEAIYCPDDRKFQIVEDIETVFRQDGYPLTTVDGVRIQFPQGWGLVRASNTEAVLSLRFEAMTADELKLYREIVWEKLAEIGQRYNVDFTSV
jgi:phosphomannomutase/phosphoglucomutase